MSTKKNRKQGINISTKGPKPPNPTGVNAQGIPYGSGMQIIEIEDDIQAEITKAMKANGIIK